MIHDLHSHTYYSMCGKDDPHLVCEAAIKGGIELLGITDHNYGIGSARFASYRAEIGELKKEFEGKLRILCGIEICTVPCPQSPPIPDWNLAPDQTLDGFDFCLVEHLDHPSSLIGGDIIGFAKNKKTKVGIAHTDLFAFCAAKGYDPLAYFTSLAEHGIFWEMNVNFDSIHGWRQHAYVNTFCQDPIQQSIVRASNIKLSVGFDGHRVEDYDPKRVIAMHKTLAQLQIPPVSFASSPSV